MQVIFRGDPLELARGEGLSRMSLDLWGVHFPMGQAVDVSHWSDDFKARLRRNAHFEIVADEAPIARAADDEASGEMPIEDAAKRKTAKKS